MYAKNWHQLMIDDAFLEAVKFSIGSRSGSAKSGEREPDFRAKPSTSGPVVLIMKRLDFIILEKRHDSP